jgi:2-methylcitrate dehydratase PrpD
MMTVKCPAQHKTTSITADLSRWAQGLQYADIPPHTAALATSQIISNIAAVKASMKHPLGQSIIAAFGKPFDHTSKQSAVSLAALSMCFEYDEVAYSGHLSASCANVALAYAEEVQRDGKQLIAAVVAANECAARFQDAVIFGPIFRGQSATYLHVIGATVARLHGLDLDEARWINALGLGFGILPVPHEHSFLSSDAKVFVAALPIRSALDACDAALCGMVGAADVMEGPTGVLAKLAEAPMEDMITRRLGQRWHTDTLSFKKYPGSAYLQAAFECAEHIHNEIDATKIGEVKKIVVHASLLTVLLDAKVRPYLRRGQSAVAALTFSIGYGIASILMTGRLAVDDYGDGHVGDHRLWALAEKVQLVEDRDLTEAMVRATVPLGELLRQAGDRVGDLPIIRDLPEADLEFIATLGPPESTFDQATMSIGARVTVVFHDGSSVTKSCDRCTGMAGPATRRDHRVLAKRKYVTAGGSDAHLMQLEKLADFDARQTAAIVRAAVLE